MVNMNELDDLEKELALYKFKLEMARRSRIYVDKSDIIAKLNTFYNTEDRFVCVSRPRRFGKSMAANMISAYYDKTVEGKKIFEGMKILDTDYDNSLMNSRDVLFINMQNYLSQSSSMNELLESDRDI